MSNLRTRLHRVSAQVKGIKAMPLLQRASAAEQVLESTLYLVEGIIDEIEALRCDETPFGCGECETCKQIDAE